MKKAALLIGLLAAIALVPGAGNATHCSSVFIFSGPAQLPENPATSGLLNAGATGCIAQDAGADVDTNLLTPGATLLIVGADAVGPAAPTNGVATFDNGDEVELTWEFQETATGAVRWVSQVVEIPAEATSVTAKAKVGGANNSVTYARTV